MFFLCLSYTIYLFRAHPHWFYKSVLLPSVGHERCKILPRETGKNVVAWSPLERLPCFGSQLKK